MSRPSDHIDSPTPGRARTGVAQPRLGPIGYLRFFWRQLTSMRTALFLLLLLAVAAIPGSLVPQRPSDPNGVIQYFADNPELAPILDGVQAFDVYTSVWFSSIYLLLFLSLIGCVIPRAIHHAKALRTPPPKTPARLDRLPSFTSVELVGGEADVGADSAEAAERQKQAVAAIESARTLLRGSGYRVREFTVSGAKGTEYSVSAERGYLRETGNLVFHTALIGVLISVGVGGAYAYSGQKLVVEGQPFVNVLSDYSSFTSGRLFNESALTPYRLVLDSFSASYERENFNAYGFAKDFRADVTLYKPGEEPRSDQIRVNHPLHIDGSETYLLGNGYAPHITVTDGNGAVVFSDAVPFLSQDANMTSLGVVKVPDALPEQIGMIGFFYPTVDALETGALTSTFPDLRNPALTLNVYTGDLGVDDGIPRSVYSLDTENMNQVAGGHSDADAIRLAPGESAELPNGIGTVTFDNLAPEGAPDFRQSVPRFASFDIHRDPSQTPVLISAIFVMLGLLTSLFIPRRRVWVKVLDTPGAPLRCEYAGLARGDDPRLDAAIRDLAERHTQHAGLRVEQ